MTKDDNAKKLQEIGASAYAAILEMVEALETEQERDEGQEDEARERIQEDPLSIRVRSGWYFPGADADERKPEEFEILLSTGGPATRIVGKLDEYGNVFDRPELQAQDWFQPWTTYHIEREDGEDVDAFLARIERADSVLLTYCEQFYFGEG
jgi:hypothetical protein